MNEPQLSVIVITVDDGRTVATTLRHLRAQTAWDQLEIVVVAPQPVAVAGFRWVRSVVAEVGRSTAAARAAGVRAATTPVVAFVEDHSFPEPGWAAALLMAHKQPCAGVGPVMGNANPATLTSWANLIIEYGPWLAPQAGGPVVLIPGHNSSYKRAVLLAYGDRLEAMLDAEGVMHWDLQARGETLWLEPTAKTNHCNFSRIGPSVTLRFYGGRLFASARCREWSWWRRAMYGVAAPLIPLVRFGRIVGAGRIPWRAVPVTLAGLVVDGFGEFIGYLTGGGNAIGVLSDLEFHRERFLTAADRQLWEAGSR